MLNYSVAELRINKYVAAKINYTHMMVGNSSPKGGDDFDLIQARLQFSF